MAQTMFHQYQREQPNLIVYGEPSSGKHRAVMEFLQEKYSPFAHYQHAVKWLNCIDPSIQKDLSGRYRTAKKS